PRARTLAPRTHLAPDAEDEDLGLLEHRDREVEPPEELPECGGLRLDLAPLVIRDRAIRHPGARGQLALAHPTDDPEDGEGGGKEVARGEFGIPPAQARVHRRLRFVSAPSRSVVSWPRSSAIRKAAAVSRARSSGGSRISSSA